MIMANNTSGLTDVTVSTTWKRSGTLDAGLDLDIAALSLTGFGVVPSEDEFVFFNNADSPSRSVRHRAGPDGIGETIGVDLARVPPIIGEIALIATLYDAVGTFGLLPHAQIKVSDRRLGTIAEFSLSESMGEYSAVHYGSVYRDGERWLFRAIGDSYPGLAEAVRKFGIEV